MDLNQFVKWQKIHPSSEVTIEIGKQPGTHEITIWVYDYTLMAGQHVKSVDEIDLQKKRDKEDRRKYEELKKKFEGIEQEAANDNHE